jgi:Na+/serine symporter
MFSRRFLVRFAALWIAMVIVGSLLPAGPKVALGTQTHSKNPIVRHRTTVRHRCTHFVAFGIAALLLSTLAHSRSQRVQAFLALFALACALEFLQHLINHAGFEYWDVRDDVYAAVVASLLGAWHVITSRLLRPDTDLKPEDVNADEAHPTRIAPQFSHNKS